MKAAGHTSLEGRGFQTGEKNGSWNHGIDENDQRSVYNMKSLGQTLRNTNIGEISVGKVSSKWDQESGISKAKMVQGQQGECGVTEAKFPQEGGYFHLQNLPKNTQVQWGLKQCFSGLATRKLLTASLTWT